MQFKRYRPFLSDRPLSLLVAGVQWPPETFLATLFKGLADAGMEITVASHQRPGSEWLALPRFSWIWAPSWDTPKSYRLASMGALAPSALARGIRDLRWIAAKARDASDRATSFQTWYRMLPFSGRRWDVIYFPWNGGAVTFSPLFGMGMPAVISCRGSGINVAPHAADAVGRLDELVASFESAARVHCVSDAIRKEAIRYGLDPEKSHVIRPAVDPYFFSPGGRQDRRRTADTIRITMTGSLVWQKGYEYALQGLQLLLERGVNALLRILGDGPDLQRILYTINDLGLERQVNLLGRVTPVEVRTHLRETDAFLLSSVSEGISNAVLEAMSCSVPIVTTNCGGMGEAVTDGIEGFVVPFRDPTAIADALAQLAASPETAHVMGNAGRKRVLSHFSLDAQVQSFKRLFESCVHSRPLDAEHSSVDNGTERELAKLQ